MLTFLLDRVMLKLQINLRYEKMLFSMPIDYVFFISLLGFTILFNPIGEGKQSNKLMREMQGKWTLHTGLNCSVCSVYTDKQT